MKKYIFRFLHLFAICSAFFVLNACDGDDEYGYDDHYDYREYNFAPFYVSGDGRSATLNGIIDSNSYIQFNQMIIQHPDIEVIFFDEATGSLDDEISFLIGRRIFERNIDTHIIDNGIVASGAVDLFLAGRNRSRGFNTSIAVNGWSDSFGNQASDFPVNDSVHDIYINYYLSIGLGGQFANDFYFFSINAADSYDLYFMNENEIQFYQIFTE